MPLPEAAANTKLLHGVQALRGIFAVLVACHHMAVQSMRYWKYEWLGGVFNQSTFRVDFFFVLSGFVLWAAHRSDVGRPGAWREFLVKRLFRLYPLLIVLTLIKTLLLLFVPGRSLISYSLLPSLLALPQDTFPIIVAAWTLPFEVCFMGELALCLALPQRLGLPVLIGWAVMLSAGGFLLGIAPALHGLGFLTHPFILEFAAGALAAEFVGQRGHRGLGILLCVVGGSGLFFGAVAHSWMASFSAISLKFFWAVVFAAILGGLALWERAVSSQAWRFKDVLGIGRASYSVFLSHGLVLIAFFRLAHPGLVDACGEWADSVLSLVVLASVLFGFGVWIWLERPLLRWTRAFTSPAPKVGTNTEAITGESKASDNPGTSRSRAIACRGRVDHGSASERLS